MSYVIDRPILTFIMEERYRCLDLIKIGLDRELLIFCIDNAYSVSEIDTARQRFDELQPVKVETVEDLM